MKGLGVLLILFGFGWGQRYTKFRPLYPSPALQTQEIPRLSEPKPIQPIILMPADLQAIYEKHLAEQRQRQLVPGYRIQVLGTTEKAAADSARFYLLETYPDLPVYVSYEVPIYRVRVGDFIDRAEANRWLEILRSDFRGAFIVPDQVMKP